MFPIIRQKTYLTTTYISGILEGNKIVDHPDVVEASPVGIYCDSYKRFDGA